MMHEVDFNFGKKNNEMSLLVYNRISVAKIMKENGGDTYDYCFD
jgi:hypothetical protein